MKIGVVYWSSTGNTEKLAERAKETIEAKGAEAVYSEISRLNRDDFFSSDAFMLGGSAQGVEEIPDEMLEFTEGIQDEFSGKKVVLFGSYGWGDGEYMDSWTELLEEKGATLIHRPVVGLEDPDEDALKEIDEAVELLLE